MDKVIAIGNILMGDDGIGIAVINNIKEKVLSLSEDIEVIIGETDFIYCLNKIDENDFIIIIDSTYLGLNPGEITVISIDEYMKNLNYSNSHHDLNLINMIQNYKKNINGFIIGIEVYNIDYKLGISRNLQVMFDDLCLNVLNKIRQNLP